MEGLILKPLQAHCDDRGRVMEMLRADDPFYAGFGQAYFSTIYPGVIKAWHAHQRQTDTMVVIKGMCKIGFFDDRPESTTCGQSKMVVAGEHRPLLVQIPPGIYHGFKAISHEEVLLVNLPNEPYNPASPDELRLAWNDPSIPFNWDPEFK